MQLPSETDVAIFRRLLSDDPEADRKNMKYPVALNERFLKLVRLTLAAIFRKSINCGRTNFILVFY